MLFRSQGVAVVHGIFGLAQGAKQVAGNKNHAKQQHALVKPAGHAPEQAGGGVRQGHGAGTLMAVDGNFFGTLRTGTKPVQHQKSVELLHCLAPDLKHVLTSAIMRLAN